jgi:hypothetical protein
VVPAQCDPPRRPAALRWRLLRRVENGRVSGRRNGSGTDDDGAVPPGRGRGATRQGRHARPRHGRAMRRRPTHDGATGAASHGRGATSRRGTARRTAATARAPRTRGARRAGRKSVATGLRGC